MTDDDPTQVQEQDAASQQNAARDAAKDAGGAPAGDDAANASGPAADDGVSAAGPTGGQAAGTAGRRLTLAVTFLTGIPLKVEGEVSPADLWGSMGWYPLVGLAMGFAAWVIYAGLVSFLPGLVAATLVVILLELLTRGLHLDGLMDTADGILSGAPRERALEIMKDHNVGAMGVASAVLLLVLKVAALGALTRAGAAAPLLAGWCAARALPALDVYWWPYARPAGTGEAFTRDHTPGPLQLAGGSAGCRRRRRRDRRPVDRRRRLLVRRPPRRGRLDGRGPGRAGRRGEAARRPHRRRLRHGHRTRRGGRAGRRLCRRRPRHVKPDTTTRDLA